MTASAPPALPIDAALPELLAGDGPFVLVAPPGAGKTTRVPLALLPRVAGAILVLEPRRVAARAAARRMAETLGEPVGQTVGWQVRDDRRASAATRILVVTEGILLRRLQDDPLLEGVGCVLLDEVHERGLDVDLCLALVREVREARPELLVGAMSATVDPGPIAAFLGARVVRAEGRSFPVEVRYLARPDDRPVQERVADGVRALWTETPGSILAFLPGVGEIRRAAELLALPVVTLSGSLPPEEQDRALAGGERRVILATNVAETSVTVPGVTAVVDGGRVRRARLDPGTGLDRLDVGWVSRASADQRAGRAGRTAPGIALRTWTERHHRDLLAAEPPEVARVDLAGAVLALLAWGADPERFAWLERPPDEALRRARALLVDLGAVDAGGLTAVGRRMSALPLHPRLARLLLAATELGARADGALAAAVLSERLPPARRDGPPTSSDLLDRMDEARQGRGDPAWAAAVRRAWSRLGGGGPAGPDGPVLRAILAGWPDRVARRRGAEPRARMVGGRGVVLDGSRVSSELFVCVELLDGAPDARVSVASAVEADWLPQTVTEEWAFDPETEQVRARRVVRYRDLLLHEHPAKADPAKAADALLAEALRARVRPDDDQLLARWACAAAWGDVPEPDPDALLALLVPGRTSFRELRAADWSEALRTHLGHAAWRRLEDLAPERLRVPSGSMIRLVYEAGRPPVLAARIQELFGLAATPRVGGGRVPVLLHLLAPNGRPQQVTDDLAGFWTRTWPEVRKELRARYPRHAWPDDPLRAAPESRPRRRSPA